jgi:hypothetical protein
VSPIGKPYKIHTHQALKLLIDMNSPLIAQTLCRKKVGKLMHLTHTRAKKLVAISIVRIFLNQPHDNSGSNSKAYAINNNLTNVVNSSLWRKTHVPIDISSHSSAIDIYLKIDGTCGPVPHLSSSHWVV